MMISKLCLKLEQVLADFAVADATVILEDENFKLPVYHHTFKIPHVQAVWTKRTILAVKDVLDDSIRNFQFRYHVKD
jgi:hypothetical protein